MAIFARDLLIRENHNHVLHATTIPATCGMSITHISTIMMVHLQQYTGDCNFCSTRNHYDIWYKRAYYSEVNSEAYLQIGQWLAEI